MIAKTPQKSRSQFTSKAFASVIGVAALASASTIAAAQGSCGGARAGTPQCNTTPAKAPFAPTGWKTTALDHFTMHAADYKKETAYYMALMNWKLRSDDGKQSVLDIGDIGTVVIVNGYEPPPAPPRPTPPPVAAGDTTAGRGGRGAGRGAGGGGGGQRQPPQAAWDSFAWAISPWNAKTVEAELKKRGLNPVADNSGPAGCESFHVKDPDGFDVQISNGCYAKQRKTPIKTVAWTTPAPFENTNWKTVWLDHISFQVSDYKGEVAFYEALLGWKGTGDEGSQNETIMCDDCGNSLIRGGNSMAPTFDPNAPRRAVINHISFGLTPFDAHGTEDELIKRGLTHSADTGQRGDIFSDTTKFKSYHTKTPLGFDLQISNETKATRSGR